MRARRETLGKLCKCTKCGTMIRISEPEQDPLLVDPIRMGPPRNPLLEELSDLSARPRQSAGNYGGGFSSDSASPAYGPMAPAPRPRKKKRSKSSSSGGASTVVTVLLSIFGIFGALCCGGIGAAYIAYGPRTIVLTAGGYEATAQGRLTKTEPMGHTTMHPFTGSEFVIGYTNAFGNVAPSIEEAKPYFDSRSQRTEYVQRGSLRGLHCYGIQSNVGRLSSIEAEMEVFIVDGKVLFTAYITGSSKAEARGNDVSESQKARSRRMDNSDAFFASLKRAGT